MMLADIRKHIGLFIYRASLAKEGLHKSHGIDEVRVGERLYSSTSAM